MSYSKIISNAGIKSNGAPTSNELSLINAISLQTLSTDMVYVRYMFVCHNAIDRDGEVFDEGLIDNFVKTLPGKGFFIKHPMSFDGDTGPGVGRIFAAKKLTMTQEAARSLLKQPDLRWPTPDEPAFILEAPFFLVKSDKNSALISDIDGGAAQDVSIGFHASSRADITDAAGNVIARRILGPGEALETSLVWLGAQPGARIHKAAGRDHRPQKSHQLPDAWKLHVSTPEEKQVELNEIYHKLTDPLGYYRGKQRENHSSNIVDYKAPLDNPLVSGK